MKTKLAASLFAVCILLATGALAQQGQPNKPAEKPSSPVDLTSQKAKQSYAIGMMIGRNIKHDGVDLDETVFMRAINDSISGAKPQMTEEEARGVIMALEQQVRVKRDAELKKESADNKKEGEAFLTTNKAKPGVVTLPDGLQYKIVKQGNGPKPTVNDVVVCNYRGTLINGKEFDSSFKRGEPATFPVGGVIKGWSEILQMMPVGSEYQVYIPAELAYGSRPPSTDIGPNATLIFDIQLISIKEKPENASKTPAPSKSEPKSAK